jgi:hypothetical protein
VLVTTLSAAPADAAPGLSQPARATTTVVPLSADLQITRTIDQRVEHETNHVYRDSQGRTRTEAGSTVTINDPATRSTIVLDTEAGTYQRLTPDRPDLGASREDNIERDQRLASPPRPLGETTIGGVLAEGTEYTVTIPAREGFPSQSDEVTLWVSTDVQLPVQTRVVEASGEAYEQTYTNIEVGTEPAAALFQIPAGYVESDPAASATPAQATCPIAYTDPVVIVSFGAILGAGFVQAVTDINQGCIFVADAGIFEPPLAGGPTVPLGLPFDEWFVFDTGGPVPFLPWTSFGDVAFAAASTQDATVVDSLVILQIF